MSKKRKITKVGDLCRKCNNPVVKRESTSRPKKNQRYRFKSYLYCEGCRIFYMLESEKVYL